MYEMGMLEDLSIAFVLYMIAQFPVFLISLSHWSKRLWFLEFEITCTTRQLRRARLSSAIISAVTIVISTESGHRHIKFT